MVHNKIIRVFILLIMYMIFTGSMMVQAQSPERIKLPGDQHFVFSLGAGYGISNNPCRECAGDPTGGVTVAFSLGYKVSEKLRIDFGPSFWIEGNDLLNNNVADSERPNNKRTTITFGATWMPFSNFPITTRIGAGAGVLNYTPDRDVVTADEKTYEETEIFKGVSAVAGFGYELRISNKVKLHPCINLWYLGMESQELNYKSYIDPAKPSLTGEFRIQLNYHF